MADPVRVALVDDDLSVRRALKRLLSSAGFEAHVFASARELLDSGFGDEAGCFVLDIHLGRVSGFDLLKELRLAGSKVPAIFITAFEDDASRARARELGASFLRKPFEGSVLLEAIAAAVEGSPGGDGTA